MPDSLLTWMLVVPVLSGVTALWSERINPQAPRWITLLGNVVLGALVWKLWSMADHGATWWASVQSPWIPSLGISLHLGMDGLSALMVALTAVLGAVAVICSWKEVNTRVGVFHLHLALMTAGVVGVFLALDLFLFFVCWEIMLLPMFFLITWWGHEGTAGPGRVHAGLKLLIYGQASGLLMLLSIIGLAFFHAHSTGVWTFDYEQLKNTSLDASVAQCLMLGFFIAFACKLPAFPFHGWLADAHTHAPTAASVDITGLLLKTSAYGILRFCLPLFPEASQAFADTAMALGVITIIYGGVLAYGQTHVKRLVAYTSISHMGFILLGIYAFNVVALQGVAIMMLAGALSTAGLFILCGQLHERLGTFDTRSMGGLWSRLPLLPPILLFFAAATLGLPGLGNFVGEFLGLMGTFKAAPWMTAIAAVGMVLGAIYALALVHRTVFGPASSDQPLPGPSVRETGLLLVFMAGLLWLGLAPQAALDASAPTLSGLSRLMSGLQVTDTAQVTVE